jgi:hypothetical protein
MFFIARVTSLNVDVDAGEETLWGVSVAWQKFFNTGLLGAIITIVASIAWQLVASAFLSPSCQPFTYIFLRICLFLGYWYLLWGLGSRLGQQDVAGYQRDEVYIGTAEERAAKDHADDDEQLHMGPGHPRKLPVLLRVPPAEADEVLHPSGVPPSMKAMESGTVTRCRSARMLGRN